MNFSCFQNDLINGINIVQKAVATKTTLEILKGILIETYEGKIKLTCNDLNLAIEVLIDAQIREEGSIVLDSRLLGEIIRKLPNQTIDFKLTDNHIEIECLNSKFKLLSFKADEFPKLPIMEKSDKIKINQNIFKKMIRKTIFAVSNDETRPILTGSLLEIEKEKATMVSIDGYRLVLKTIEIENETISKTVIPGKTLNELLKIIGNEEEKEIEINITKKYISFDIENVKVISKILEGEFIKYKQIIPQEFKTEVTINTKEFYQSIERASLIAREAKSATIKMSFENEFVETTAISEIGTISDKVKIKKDGENVEIGFNPKYLSEVLKVIESEETIIKLSSSLSPCVIKSKEDDKYIYLVLPVRINN